MSPPKTPANSGQELGILMGQVAGLVSNFERFEENQKDNFAKLERTQEKTRDECLRAIGEVKFQTTGLASEVFALKEWKNGNDNTPGAAADIDGLKQSRSRFAALAAFIGLGAGGSMGWLTKFLGGGGQ